MVKMLDFGIDQAVPKGIAAGKISEGAWELKYVLSVKVQLADGVEFDFFVDLTDGNRHIARLWMIVSFPSRSDTMKLSNWIFF